MMGKALLFIGLFSVAGWAAPIDLGKTTHRIDFLAVGQPSALKIAGKLAPGSAMSGKLEVAKNELSGVATIKLDSFDTGIDLRNRHMKEKYLETAKFPEAKISLKPIKLSGEAVNPVQEYSGPFTATMELHGVSKEISGVAKLKKEKDLWSGNYEFSFELSDYGIDIPSYLGIKVSKTVKVNVDFKQ